MGFPERLREALASQGRGKRYALAMAVGVNPSSVTRWLNGGPISVESLIAVCEVLQVSMDWLVLGRGELLGGPSPALSAEEERLLGSLRRMPPQAAVKLAELLDAIGH